MCAQTDPSVRSAARTLEILETIRELCGAGVSEIAAELDVPKSTAHNYLSTLEGDDYLLKRDGEYHLSARFLALGEYVRDNTPLYGIAKPELDDLAAETGELSHLMIEENGYGIYLYQGRGEHAVHADAHGGKRVHLHATALGKAILAHLPEERVEAVVAEHGLPPSTENTITSERRLYDELERIRDRGVAFDDEERLVGMRCVATPIHGNEGVLGSISVSAPASRMDGERFTEDIPEALRRVANVIEINVKYS